MWPKRHSCASFPPLRSAVTAIYAEKRSVVPLSPQQKEDAVFHASGLPAVA